MIAVSILLIAGLSSARAGELSQHDARLYGAAFSAASAGNWALAWHEADAARDPLPAVALRWLQLKEAAGNITFSDYMTFLAQHRDWPGQRLLRQRAEGMMASVPDSIAARWFAENPPTTAAGRLREADLWLAEGRRSAAEQLVRQVWIESDFDRADENAVLRRYHTMLRRVDHEARLDRLLWDGQTAAARRMLPRVSSNYRALAEARLALDALEPGVEHLIARVPASLRRDPGLVYDRIRWRRRKGHYDDAIALLESLPRERDHATAWAIERQILARYALGQGKPALAYRIAAHHTLTSGANFADLEFFAGWTALRDLHEPRIAYYHFVRLYNSATLPISLGRGAYWAARAAAAMGDEQLATSWYHTAAEHITTYYGQLAAAQLGRSVSPALFAEPRPHRDEIIAFNKRELVKVSRDLAQIGDLEEITPFIHHLAKTAVTADDYELVARLAIALDRPDLAIATAKQASYNGVTLLDEGYPISEIPSGSGVERPLVLAMTRQESAFDQHAVSRAGARGLMQLLPATARLMAKSLHLPFSKSRLTSDVHYNLTLGRAYLTDLLDDFSGSYLLAVASYNAGPARVRQWIADFGDPRTSNVNAVDWVEAIPVAETRNYVQRVLENLQIYRLRLGDRNLAFSLASDLRR